VEVEVMAFGCHFFLSGGGALGLGGAAATGVGVDERVEVSTGVDGETLTATTADGAVIGVEVGSF
jgi:hypothetical protein